MMPLNDLRTPYNRRLSALETERSSWVSHWQEISRNFQPTRGRYFVTDRNRGEKRHQHIIDNTTTRANRILAAGLMAGMTSPARPWFRLGLSDVKLMEQARVKKWLADSTDILRGVFARSNMYRTFHSQYEEMGLFANGPALIDDDYDNLVHAHSLTAGEYFLASDHKGYVNTLYREFDMTAYQIVEKFGKENVSTRVRNMVDKHTGDAWVTVCHAIEPRLDREYGKRDSKNMPWRSVYFEKGNNEKPFLRESGFLEFPAMVPRWNLAGGDVYGTSPAMEVLGSAIQLQSDHVLKGKAMHYRADPPAQVPESMRGAEDLLPGGVSYYNDMAGPGAGIRSAFNVDLDVNVVLEDIRDIRTRIDQTFFVDLFLMISQLDNVRTATEIVARQEEKLLMLGPVLERLHNEMLDPAIEITFNKALRAGLLPPPPRELQGQELKIEYVSMLAQAQRAVGTSAVDRLLGTVGALAQFRPDSLDKINADNIVDGYADMLGVDPDYIVANEDVAIIRSQKAQMQMQMAQAQMAPGAAQAAKTLSEVDPDRLNQNMKQFSGL